MHNNRVVISINSSWNIYNFRAGLIRALVDRGYEVTAASPLDDYSPRLAELGCRHIPLAMDSKGSSPVRDSALFLRYLQLLRRERPGAFLGYTIKPNVYGSLAAHALGIPVINNVSGLGTVFIRETLLTRLVTSLYRRALRSSSTVFFQNEEDRILFLKLGLVCGERACLLPGSGVDLQRFRPQPSPIREQKMDGPCFLLVARMLWDKGIGEYVDAARIIKQHFPGVRFQLLGFVNVENREAISREQIEAWTREGIIEYLGATDDVRSALAAADCVVLPSYREGTPRTLLEAAAMAKPIITTDAPGCRNVVDDGVNGFLCAVRDAADLAEKVMTFIHLDLTARDRMGAASRVKAESQFAERIVVGRYLAALDRIGTAAEHAPTKPFDLDAYDSIEKSHSS